MVNRRAGPCKKISNKFEDKRIIDIHVVRKELMRVVTKYHDGNLEHINYFSEAAICMEFIFVKHLGWKRIYDLISD